jgi:hypothetical protein
LQTAPATTETKKTEGSAGGDAAGDVAKKDETAVSEPSSGSDAMSVVSKASRTGGVPGVLELLKEKCEESDYCWWSFDALAGLCAGNGELMSWEREACKRQEWSSIFHLFDFSNNLFFAEKARAELFNGGGITLVLDGMQRFPWDANVQMKANWLLASMASSYSGELGSQGAVEMVVAGMRACEEDYQVQTSGVRCLQNLIAGNTVNTARAAPDAGGVVAPLVPMSAEQLDNRARARAAGAIDLIQASLDRNPEDGQLQYRGAQLLERLKEVEEEKVKTVQETDKKLGRGASSARLVGPGSFHTLASLSPRENNNNGNAGSANTLGSARSGSGLVGAPSMAKSEYYNIITYADQSCSLSYAAIFNRSYSVYFLFATVAAAPGFSGVSGRVAAVIQSSGLSGVIELLKAEKSPTDGGSGGKKDAEVARWCCDAIFTMVNGNATERTKAFEAGGLDAVIERLACEGDAFAWHEDLALKCCWALLAFAPAYALEIGAKGGIDALVKTMLRHSNHHDLQVAAVKLLSLLTIETTGENLKRARLANAITIVKTCVKCHPDDGTLQYRGVNLLERLEPGCTASMPKLNMVRSASMAAAEMAGAYKSFRVGGGGNQSSRAGGSQATARGVAGGVSDAEMQMANAKAIAEVDELAEQVEESDDEGDSSGAAHTGVAKRRNSKVSSNALLPVADDANPSIDAAAAAAAAALVSSAPAADAPAAADAAAAACARACSGTGTCSSSRFCPCAGACC